MQISRNTSILPHQLQATLATGVAGDKFYCHSSLDWTGLTKLFEISLICQTIWIIDGCEHCEHAAETTKVDELILGS